MFFWCCFFPLHRKRFRNYIFPLVPFFFSFAFLIILALVWSICSRNLCLHFLATRKQWNHQGVCVRVCNNTKWNTEPLCVKKCSTVKVVFCFDEFKLAKRKPNMETSEVYLYPPLLRWTSINRATRTLLSTSSSLSCPTQTSIAWALEFKTHRKFILLQFRIFIFCEHKKVRCFSPLICGDACSMSSVVEKAKMQFVIVRSIVKGKNHLWVCSVHAQMHTQADDTNIVCMVSRVSASVCRVFHRRDKSNGHD